MKDEREERQLLRFCFRGVTRNYDAAKIVPKLNPGSGRAIASYSKASASEHFTNKGRRRRSCTETRRRQQQQFKARLRDDQEKFQVTMKKNEREARGMGNNQSYHTRGYSTLPNAASAIGTSPDRGQSKFLQTRPQTRSQRPRLASRAPSSRRRSTPDPRWWASGSMTQRLFSLGRRSAVGITLPSKQQQGAPQAVGGSSWLFQDAVADGHIWMCGFGHVEGVRGPFFHELFRAKGWYGRGVRWGTCER